MTKARQAHATVDVATTVKLNDYRVRILPNKALIAPSELLEILNWQSVSCTQFVGYLARLSVCHRVMPSQYCKANS